MFKRFLFPAVAVALLAFGLATAWAAERPGGPRNDGVCNGPCLDVPRGGGPLARLDLSDAQRDQIRAILDAERESMRTLREATQQSREATRDALHAEKVNAGEVRRLAHEQADRRVDLQLARQQTREKIDAVLTAEQRQQLQQQREQRQQRREERRDEHFAGGPRHEDRMGGGMHGGPGCDGPGRRGMNW